MATTRARAPPGRTFQPIGRFTNYRGEKEWFIWRWTAGGLGACAKRRECPSGSSRRSRASPEDACERRSGQGASTALDGSQDRGGPRRRSSEPGQGSVSSVGYPTGLGYPSGCPGPFAERREDGSCSFRPRRREFFYAGWRSTPKAMYSTATRLESCTPRAARAISLLARI